VEPAAEKHRRVHVGPRHAAVAAAADDDEKVARAPAKAEVRAKAVRIIGLLFFSLKKARGRVVPRMLQKQKVESAVLHTYNTCNT
jgi:hypothetical protein